MPVHGVTSWGWLSRRGRVLSRAGIGVLSWVASPDLVDEAVGDGLAWEMRLRAVPSRLGVYFVLGLCLFSDLPYGQVLRELTSGLEAALAAAGWRVPAATALTRVRRRIGEKPLESLFRRLCSALSPGCSPWSHACGLLVVAWDGTTVDAGDSPPDAAAFGKPGTGGNGVRRRRNPGRGTAGEPMGARRRAAGRPAGRWRRVPAVAAGDADRVRHPGAAGRGLRAAARQGQPASRPWPAACWAACTRACCCSPTAISTATSCGTPPRRRARTCCGGSRAACTFRCVAGAAGRVLSGAHQRPARRAGPAEQERHAAPPRQQAGARHQPAARHHRPGHRVRPHRHRQ